MVKSKLPCNLANELLKLTTNKNRLLNSRLFHTEPQTHSVPLVDICGEQLANDIRNDLTENEQYHSLKNKEKRSKYKGVDRIHSNFLHSNTPLEDRRVGYHSFIKEPSTRTRFKTDGEVESVLFGVLDGHGSGYTKNFENILNTLIQN